MLTKNGKVLIVAVTGVPCTGKTYFAKEVKASGGDVGLIEINDVVRRYHTYSRLDKFGTKIVNLRMLAPKLKSEIGKERANVVLVVGHLAQEVNIGYGMAVVLRQKLGTLAARMEQRGYPKEKIRENLVAEALDYCGRKMAQRCKYTYEVETARERAAMRGYIAQLAAGGRPRAPRKREIDEFSGLEGLIRGGNRYRL